MKSSRALQGIAGHWRALEGIGRQINTNGHHACPLCITQKQHRNNTGNNKEQTQQRKKSSITKAKNKYGWSEQSKTFNFFNKGVGK